MQLLDFLKGIVEPYGIDGLICQTTDLHVKSLTVVDLGVAGNALPRSKLLHFNLVSS